MCHHPSTTKCQITASDGKLFVQFTQPVYLKGLTTLLQRLRDENLKLTVLCIQNALEESHPNNVTFPKSLAEHYDKL